MLLFVDGWGGGGREQNTTSTNYSIRMKDYFEYSNKC